MTTNEIKKELYRQKPLASLEFVNKTGLLYTTRLSRPDDVFNFQRVSFIVPLVDIGDAVFSSQMGAQLLIRYLVQTEEVVGNSLGKKDIYENGELIGSQG